MTRGIVVSPKRLRVGDIVHMDTGRMFLVEAITELTPQGPWRLKIHYLLSGRRLTRDVVEGTWLYHSRLLAQEQSAIALPRLQRELIAFL